MHAKILSLIIAGAMALTGCGVKTSEFATSDGVDYVTQWAIFRDTTKKVDTTSEDTLMNYCDGNTYMIKGKIKNLDLKPDEWDYIHFTLDTEGIDVPCRVDKNTIGIDIKNGMTIMGFGHVSDFSVEIGDGITEFYCQWIEDENGNFLNDEAVERINKERGF